MAMKSFFSTSQLTIPAPPVAHSSTYPEDGRHVQTQQNISTPQSDDPSVEPFTLIPSIPITPTLLLNTHTALNSYLIKRKRLLGDNTVWKLFLKPHSSSHGIGHSLLDYSPFHTIAPQDLKDTEEEFFTCTWVIEKLWGFFSPQPIYIKTGALVCLQNTVHAFSLTHPRLLTIWGIVGGLAWAEPRYQIHHFIIIAHSLTYPPTSETEIHPFITILTFYLDPDQPCFALSPPLIRQRPVSGTNLWARPLCKREREVNETIEREESE
jgi:hypothetical protein